MSTDKQPQTLRSRLQRAADANSVAGASNALFGGLVDRYEDAFRDLDEDLEKANISTLFRTYVAQMVGATLFAALAGFGVALSVILVLQPSLPTALITLLTVPVILGVIVFSALYIRPSWKARHRAADIEINLPFALNHMSAISGSGVPPSDMFKLLINFDEYGEISAEAEKIVTKVHAFGKDVTTAIKETAEETPSEDLEEIFYGIVSTIETGGSLEQYLEESASRTLFDYRIERQKQIDRLTTFASFYTALLVAAPLFLITILAVLEVIGGDLFGLPIKAACPMWEVARGMCPPGVIDLGAYVLIPVANTLFIIVLEVTQPEI